jgi:hypothetical protein
MQGQMTTPSMEWEIVPSAAATHVRILGRLDGTGNLVAALAPLLSDARVIFDASGIRRITSPGVAEWVRFLETLDKRGVSYELERCSLAFVQQLNMISIFKGKGLVRSFYAPYFCHWCDESMSKLIVVGDQEEIQIAERPMCPKCAQVTEFDDVETSFLAFLEKKSGYPARG